MKTNTANEVDILLIGEGHGFIALVQGMKQASERCSVYSTDEEAIRVAKDMGFSIATSIRQWVQDWNGLVISSGYREFVPVEFLAKARFINIHYAAFPKYRGMHSIVWALLNGERKIAVTVHAMTGEFDAGPILWQKHVRVGIMNSWQLMLVCDAIVERKILRIVNLYLAERLKGRVQSEKDATYVAKRNREDCRVNWEVWTAELFVRHLRALVPPYPRPFFSYRGVDYEIVQAKVLQKKYFEIPGHVVYVSKTSVLVKLVDGVLEVAKLYSPKTGEVEATAVFSRPGARLGSASQSYTVRD
jgi:methionyl-tRNA formyltransferase